MNEILLIDNNTITKTEMESIIAGPTEKVFVESSLDDALKEMKIFQFPILILSEKIEQYSWSYAVELFYKVNPTLVIILIVEKKTKEMVYDAMSIGVDFIVQKPLTIDFLKNLLMEAYDLC